MGDEKIPFTEHLEELRKRIIICFIAIGIGFAVCYSFAERIYLVLAKPLQQALPSDSSLIFTSPTEAFLTYLKTAFISGLFLAIPVILYQIWKFVAPGLYKNEAKYVVPFVISSSILFIGGALFGYLIVFPLGFKFLMSFTSESILALPSMREYFNFVTKLLLAFGLVFETPIFILFLTRMNIVTHQMLSRQRKYFILVAFVLGAVLTPPDVVTQTLMAVPLVILYELSVLIARIFAKKPTV
ncbi:MAG: twin-arginine translocase subunit TatC [Deltaproteobacteria bacterium]|nr:twin-arginine translocase subunit TatC [Deltaproteobacteria bacterium]